MNCSDWVIVITTIFLGAAAIIGSAISDEIQHRWFPPKLITSFKLQPPYCRKTKYLPVNHSVVDRTDLRGVGDLWKYGGKNGTFFFFTN